MDISCLNSLQLPDTINKANLATLTLASNATEIKFVDPNNIHLLGQTGGWVLVNDCSSNRTELIKVGQRVNTAGITTFPILGRGYNPNDCTTTGNASTGYEFSANAEFYVGYADRKYWCDIANCIKTSITNIKNYVDANILTCSDVETCVQSIITPTTWDCTKTIDCLKNTSAPNNVDLSNSTYLFGINCDGSLARVKARFSNYSSSYGDFNFLYGDGDRTPTTPGYYWERIINLSPIVIGANCGGGYKLRLTTQLDFRPTTSPQPSRALNLYCSAKTYVNGVAGDNGDYFGGGVAIISHDNSLFGHGDTGPTINFTGYYDLAVGTNPISLKININDPSTIGFGEHQFTINSIRLRGEVY